MNRIFPLSLVLATSIAAIPATAAEKAPVPTSLLNRSGIVCVKVSAKGTVKDAFVVRSTGDATADADMIQWIRTVAWPAAKPGNSTRNSWQPVPVAMGAVEVPPVPDSCAPPRV
jgi:TonB family protein